MNLIPRPSSNIDTLEGALYHMLTICGALPSDAIDIFARQYAAIHGQKLPDDYARKVLIPHMKRSGKLYLTAKDIYAINPLIKSKPKEAIAFWLFIYLMEEHNIDLQTVIQGPHPAQISYFREDRVYHIVTCSGDGSFEMAMAAQLEIATEQRKRQGVKHLANEERFFFIFSSEDNLKQAKYTLKTPTRYCILEHEDGAAIPVLKFIDPNNLP